MPKFRCSETTPAQLKSTSPTYCRTPFLFFWFARLLYAALTPCDAGLMDAHCSAVAGVYAHGFGGVSQYWWCFVYCTDNVQTMYRQCTTMYRPCTWKDSPLVHHVSKLGF